MSLDANAVGTKLDPTTFEWTEADTILYALGVGARPPHELDLLDERRGPGVLPTFALLANWWAVRICAASSISARFPSCTADSRCRCLGRCNLAVRSP